MILNSTELGVKPYNVSSNILLDCQISEKIKLQ